MEDLYHDYKLIREMKVNIKLKVRLLSDLMTMYPDMWQVVGITANALKVFERNDFLRIKRMGINRSHIKDSRYNYYTKMLTEPIIEYKEWWADFCEFDKTVLATSTENKSNIYTDIFEIDPKLGLFKAQGYAWKHSKNEIDFLKNLYNSKKTEL